MAEDNKKLRQFINDYGSSVNTSNGVHLTESQLIKLCREIDDDDEETLRLRAHLTACDLCLTEFKDISQFFTASGENDFEADKSEIEQSWKAFLPKIKETDLPSNAVDKGKVVTFPKKQKTRTFSAQLGWAIAAALLISTGLSLFWSFRLSNEKQELAMRFNAEMQNVDERLKSAEQSEQKLKTEKDRLSQETAELAQQKRELQQENQILRQLNQSRHKKPEADGTQAGTTTALYNIYPSNLAQNGNEKTIVIPDTAKNIVLIANDISNQNDSGFRAELLNQSGNVVWRKSGLRKNFLGNIPLIITNSAIKNGSYRLVIYRIKTGADELINNYSIKFEFK